MTRRASRWHLALGLLAVLILFGSGAKAEQVDPSPGRDQAALDRIANPPLGLPNVPIPADNVPTIEKVQLGRKLFFDQRLSHSGKLSCGSCHLPDQGFTVNESATPAGHDGAILRRNAPTLLNVAYQRSIFLDGRQTSMEKQALEPFVEPDEMANPSIDAVILKIRRLPDYKGQFERAFGKGPSPERIGQAIASYERTLLAADTPFDRWHFGQQEDAVDAAVKKGFELFKGKAGCAACHVLDRQDALFTDHRFHDDGIGWIPSRDIGASRRLAPAQTASGGRAEAEYDVDNHVKRLPPSDMGRFEVTKEFIDVFRYRTPSLRNIALTAPYMHDGSIRTLQKVVAYYNDGGFRHFGIDPLVRRLRLNSDEQEALVAFLKSLTATNIGELIVDASSEAMNPD